MTAPTKPPTLINSFDAFCSLADFSYTTDLNADPEASAHGDNRYPREVLSGHFVPVRPSALPNAQYVCHSKSLFNELGLSADILQDKAFSQAFSGELPAVKDNLVHYGWATGYALSIMGTEYTQQCPFRTGNGYGDGRAISIFEGVFAGNRWEFQLKGAGPTPYCRGGDGRAVLRSSVREFLAQEFMHALGVPTSRSFTLFTSTTETVKRPWYSNNSQSFEPDIMVANPVAISTRVAPSFIRVGQFELFARRARDGSGPQALKELEMLTRHTIAREYHAEIDNESTLSQQVVKLAELFSQRLIKLVTHWLRVGYCQGNFNSDNCSVGGYTLDYGPFGFCELFNTQFQPWTGGGEHYAFFNQPLAAEANFHMFWAALKPLIADDSDANEALDKHRKNFAGNMQLALQAMWTSKLGLATFDPSLINQFLELTTNTPVDYTLFFRELSKLPQDITTLKDSFYREVSTEESTAWNSWFKNWRACIDAQGNLAAIADRMKAVNPKYTWREWLIVPAYEQAALGNYDLIEELQAVFSDPYGEQSQEIEEQYYRLKPLAFFNLGGISHYSCSS